MSSNNCLLLQGKKQGILKGTKKKSPTDARVCYFDETPLSWGGGGDFNVTPGHITLFTVITQNSQDFKKQ